MQYLYLRRPILAAAFGITLIAVIAIPAAQASDPAPAAAGPAMLGGALPGGAVISARSVMLAPVSGKGGVAVPIAGDGSFKLVGLAPGPYRLAVTSTAIAKQTQGATFGEKVNAGLAAAGSALAQGASVAKHDTAKNSVGNVRAREAAPPDPAASPSSPSAQAAHVNNINGGMPNRISMNVTIAKQTQSLDVDGAPIVVEVGPDGSLTGRASQP